MQKCPLFLCLLSAIGFASCNAWDACAASPSSVSCLPRLRYLRYLRGLRFERLFSTSCRPCPCCVHCQHRLSVLPPTHALPVSNPGARSGGVWLCLPYVGSNTLLRVGWWWHIWTSQLRHLSREQGAGSDRLDGCWGLKTLVAFPELGSELWGSSTCPANCVDEFTLTKQVVCKGPMA